MDLHCLSLMEGAKTRTVAAPPATPPSGLSSSPPCGIFCIGLAGDRAWCGSPVKAPQRKCSDVSKYLRRDGSVPGEQALRLGEQPRRGARNLRAAGVAARAQRGQHLSGRPAAIHALSRQPTRRFPGVGRFRLIRARRARRARLNIGMGGPEVLSKCMAMIQRDVHKTLEVRKVG